MERDEKIDYTNYLRDKPRETDPEKISKINDAIATALLVCGIRGRVSCDYYKDGRVVVRVNGTLYGMFDYNTRRFFSGYVGE